MFPLRKERELQIVSTTDDDDEGGPATYEKPDLDCIIGASLMDDLGVNSVERILWFFRSRLNRRANDSPVGLGKDIRAVQVARQKTKSEARMPMLSSNG